MTRSTAALLPTSVCILTVVRTSPRANAQTAPMVLTRDTRITRICAHLPLRLVGKQTQGLLIGRVAHTAVEKQVHCSQPADHMLGPAADQALTLPAGCINGDDPAFTQKNTRLRQREPSDAPPAERSCSRRHLRPSQRARQTCKRLHRSPAPPVGLHPPGGTDCALLEIGRMLGYRWPRAPLVPFDRRTRLAPDRRCGSHVQQLPRSARCPPRGGSVRPPAHPPFCPMPGPERVPGHLEPRPRFTHSLDACHILDEEKLCCSFLIPNWNKFAMPRV